MTLLLWLARPYIYEPATRDWFIIVLADVTDVLGEVNAWLESMQLTDYIKAGVVLLIAVFVIKRFFGAHE